MTFLLPVIAVFVLLLGLAGLGHLLMRLLRLSMDAEVGVAACLGLAVVVTVAGVANLFSAQTPGLMRLMLAIGVVGGIVMASTRRRAIAAMYAPLIRDLPMGWLVVAAVLLAFVVGSGHLDLHEGDDLGGYLNVLERTIQTGLYGDDIFSSRVIETSLGGQNAALLLAHTLVPTNQLNVLDIGLGPVLATLGLIELGMRLRVERRLMLLMGAVWLVAVMSTLYWRNLTTLELAVGPLLAIARLMLPLDDVTRQARANLVAALIAGMVCTLKSSLVPGTVLLAASLVLASEFPRWPRVMARALVAAIVTLTVMLPWTTAMNRYVHTELYPLLGKGYHGSAYGMYYSPRDLSGSFIAGVLVGQLASVMFLGTGLMALGLLWAGARQRSRLLVAAGLGTLGLLVAASMVDVATTGLSARYAFPLFMPAALLALTVLAAPSAPLTPIFSPRAVAIGMSMCLIGSLWYGSALSFKGMLSSLRKPPQNLAQGAEQTHALQAAVPAGQRILTVYPRVYQMDFRRNPIWQIDLVGACSPPPGLPLGQGGEKVRDYLRHNGVRYMIVSLRDFAPIANEYFRSRTHSPNPWQRRYTDNCIQWETDLKQLVAVSAVLKQDGPVYVLDLGAAVQ